MKPQIAMQDQMPSQELFEPVRYDPHESKPHGGFWTSTDQGDGRSAWMDFHEHERGLALQSTWQLIPSKNARIFHVRSFEDEKFLHDHYQADAPKDKMEKTLRHYALSGLIDWEKFSQDFDALHYEPFRVPHASVFALWDVESTLWTNWKFEEVIQLTQGRPRLRQEPKDIDLTGLDNLPDLSL